MTLCVGMIYSFVSMFIHSKFVVFFLPMIVQVQDFSKDVNAQCNVLNIRQPVLQVITVLSFAKSHQTSENGSKVIVKNCVCVCMCAHHG